MVTPPIMHCSRPRPCSASHHRQCASKLEQAQKLRSTCRYSLALTGITSEHAFIADLQHGAVGNAPDIGLPLGCAANTQLWMFSHSMLNDLCCKGQSCPILLLLQGQQLARCRAMFKSAHLPSIGHSRIMNMTEAVQIAKQVLPSHLKHLWQQAQ